MTQYRYINRARTFFRKIGLPTREVSSSTPDPENTFAQGCWIQDGVLHYCVKRVLVGSLLHEAGHLAITPRQYWPRIQPGDFESQDIPCPFGWGGDFAAEAWGYAAAQVANIPSEAAVYSLTKIDSVDVGPYGQRRPISEERFERQNEPGFFYELSQAQFAIVMSLIKSDHIGIPLLIAAGMTTDFPNMQSWFWHKRCRGIHPNPRIEELRQKIIQKMVEVEGDQVLELWK